jgi:hypothetical protein
VEAISGGTLPASFRLPGIAVTVNLSTGGLFTDGLPLLNGTTPVQLTAAQVNAVQNQMRNFSDGSGDRHGGVGRPRGHGELMEGHSTRGSLFAFAG